MPKYRSATTTHGRNMGARAPWRATGMTDDDFGKPDIAVGELFHPVRAGPRSPARSPANWLLSKSRPLAASPKNSPLRWMMGS